MLPYVVRRLAEMVPLLIFLSLFMFVVLRVLPGDPLRGLIGDELQTISEEDRAALLREFGLDKPLYVQYFTWVGDLLTGDWGVSFQQGRPVREIIAAPAFVSAQLAALSWITAVAISLPIGIFSALKRNTWPDAAVNVAALVGVATPNFLQGLVVIIIFAVILRVLPTNGFVSFSENPIDALKYMILPISTLATGTMASLVRQMRSAMLEVMNEDYIRTARAKGLAPNRVITRHALKNALLPIVTIAGLQLGNLLSGTVIVETMFSIPGMGRLTVNAIYGQDYSLVQSIVLILAITGVLANLVADLMYVQLDPRIRI